MYDELVERLHKRIALTTAGSPLQDDLLDAADAIEELSKPRWIPVTERLPETYTWVLVFSENHKVGFDAFYDGARWKNAVMNSVIVTHWMPLPKGPEEE